MNSPATVRQRLLAGVGLYRLLAKLFLEEVDDVVLRLLRHDKTFGPALEDLPESEALARLRAEYARVFILNIPPYESAFIEPEMILNASCTREVSEAYAGLGLSPRPGRRVGAADHIGLELECMGQLAERAAEALATSEDRLAAQLQIAERFLSDHLGSWGPIFALAVARDARLPFYRTLAEFTAEFLVAELDALSGHSAGLGRAGAGRQPTPEPDPSVFEGEFRDIARYLVAPARAGFYLSREEMFRIAGHLRLPLAPVERSVMLVHLFDQAARYGVFDELLAWLECEAARVAAAEQKWEQRYPAAAPTLGRWRRLAEVTASGLARMRTLAASGAT